MSVVRIGLVGGVMLVGSAGEVAVRRDGLRPASGADTLLFELHLGSASANALAPSFFHRDCACRPAAVGPALAV